MLAAVLLVESVTILSVGTNALPDKLGEIVKLVDVPNVSRLSVVIVVFNCVVPVVTLMILCAIVLENVILAELMLVAVQDGLVVNVEYGIVWIVRKATTTIVRNVDLLQNQKRLKKLKNFSIVNLVKPSIL